jgi:glycerol uptake facilitator-like aquaporin
MNLSLHVLPPDLLYAKSPIICSTIPDLKIELGSDWGYAFVPVLAPITGAALAVGLYLLLA